LGGDQRLDHSMTAPGSGPVAPEGITIDTAKIRKVNADARFAQGFLCIPAPDSERPLVSDIDHAISGIVVTLAPDQRFHAVEVSAGIAIYVFPVDSPKHAVQIAESIAQAIRPLRFTGTITACADKVGPRPRTGRFAYSAAICALDAALDNDQAPLAFRAVKNNWDSWAVQSPVFKDIVEMLAGWATTNATGPILAGLHFTMSRCEPHQIVEVITRCCDDVGWAELLFPTANGDYYVHFTTEGWILPGTEVKAGKTNALESLTRLLEDMAPLYDYAAVSRVHFGLITPVSVLDQQVFTSPGQTELSADHAVMKRSVPGIFGVQVLGPEHADLQPAGSWHVRPLSSGRRMFTAPAPERWWSRLENFPAEGFEALREANKDLLGRWA
jgi:hypothetical protein